jgi:hypothetical protein
LGKWMHGGVSRAFERWTQFAETEKKLRAKSKTVVYRIMNMHVARSALLVESGAARGARACGAATAGLFAGLVLDTAAGAVRLKCLRACSGAA